jgi:queuosine precursor transporter
MLKEWFNIKDVDRSLLMKMVMVHLVIIASANYLVQFSGTMFGYHFTWAMFTFPLVVIATDLTVRLTNKYQARAVIAIAFPPAIIISALLADWRIGFASALAYLIGQMFDVSVFQRIRERFTDMWWVAPAISTVVANLVDTYLFFYAAFANHPTNEFMAANWVEIATVDVIFKIVISLVLFLPIYGVLLAHLKSKLSIS